MVGSSGGKVVIAIRLVPDRVSQISASYAAGATMWSVMFPYPEEEMDLFESIGLDAQKCTEHSGSYKCVCGATHDGVELYIPDLFRLIQEPRLDVRVIRNRANHEAIIREAFEGGKV